MTTKYGDFSPPQFNADGDRYAAKQLPGDRDVGLAFKAPTSKRGKTNDACFAKAKVLFEGEKYTDPSRQKLIAVAEKKKLSIVDVPFKLCSPMKVSTGPGDFQGTLQGKVEYIADHCKAKIKKGDVISERPNLYTSPGKKGTYGYVMTTISARHQAAGVQGEYTYAAEPYKRPQLAAGASKQKTATEAPFVPSSPAKRGGYGVAKTNIANSAAGAVGEYSYSEQGPAQSRAADSARTSDVPFVPARAPKKGHNCTLTKFPDYSADPDQIKADARRQAKHLELQALSSNSPWHPSSVPKVAATRSIVRMNL